MYEVTATFQDGSIHISYHSEDSFYQYIDVDLEWDPRGLVKATWRYIK